MTALCAGTASDVHLPTAGADNSSLPGMGGVFNTTNCHLYHYAGNNPVRYVDPEGRFTVSIGFQGAAGAGSAGAIEGGIKIGFSEEGFSSGLYKSMSIGSEFGESSFAGISVSFDWFSKGVKTEKSQSLLLVVHMINLWD